MKTDCIYYDECDNKHLSSCCGAEIKWSDICCECGEHCDEMCEDCEDYKTEDNELGKTE